MKPVSHCHLQPLETIPTGRLVLNLMRAFEKHLIRQLERMGVDNLTFSDINLLRQIPSSGIRISQLAQEAMISKQAVAKNITSLQERGYLQVSEDPKDARARIVTFSAHGRKLLKQAVTVISSIDESYSACLGADRYRALRADLDVLVKFLQSQGEGESHEQQ
ncbi:MAG TPA: MarR family transcriptional regulator [Oligoflexus sp.]|uniref:MarR family winged helix-turn-helix transcriptional regulator n=1 Tax=Oligoflexus sp. TaxID=1971216 RepID=UPI002D447C6A|nr:MarR family transcriptional regulator [Oligoflexus sp.]HYX35095.1 MarR family transcriptional regulator [Oligoflexus sp.]